MSSEFRARVVSIEHAALLMGPVPGVPVHPTVRALFSLPVSTSLGSECERYYLLSTWFSQARDDQKVMLDALQVSAATITVAAQVAEVYAFATETAKGFLQGNSSVSFSYFCMCFIFPIIKRRTVDSGGGQLNVNST